jgi:hypothetical protein
MSTNDQPIAADLLLDGALGQLSPDEAEALYVRDPRARDRVAELRQSLDTVLDDGDGWDVPAGLFDRVVRAVDGSRVGRAAGVMDFAPSRLPFRLADLAVAALVLGASLLTLAPALQRAHLLQNQMACASNLQRLGQGIHGFVSTHGHYPYPAEDCVTPAAGIYASVLNDNRLLRDTSALDCPCNGPDAITSVPPQVAFCSDGSGQGTARSFLKNLDYSYNIGYSVERKPCKIPREVHGEYPILADRPNTDDAGTVLPGNSKNHGGRGQNVFFSGGHVRWLNSRKLGDQDQDIFVNRRSELQPGMDDHDAVIGPTGTRFYPGK